jgi:hypothetical protein
MACGRCLLVSIFCLYIVCLDFVFVGALGCAFLCVDLSKCCAVLDLFHLSINCVKVKVTVRLVDNTHDGTYTIAKISSNGLWCFV